MEVLDGDEQGGEVGPDDVEAFPQLDEVFGLLKAGRVRDRGTASSRDRSVDMRVMSCWVTKLVW